MQSALSDLREARRLAYEGMRGEERQWVQKLAKDVLIMVHMQQAVCHEVGPSFKNVQYSASFDDMGLLCWHVIVDVGTRLQFVTWCRVTVREEACEEWLEHCVLQLALRHVSNFLPPGYCDEEYFVLCSHV